MRVLAIETSCDETGIAIVEGSTTPDGFVFETLGNALLSQAALHAEYGGVYPTLAKREHEKNLPVMLKEALTEAGLDGGEDIDAVIVTAGPGLEPALWSGITFAERLAKSWGKPLFPVNHMEGHLLSSLVRSGKLHEPPLPLLGLLISGGHTEFVLMRDWFTYEVLGETLDDAVGEAFDKVARMLGLPYPGGPHISRLAEASRREEETKQVEEIRREEMSTNKSLALRGREIRGLLRDELSSRRIELPRPMLKADTCDMSFSGLKTAALYALRDYKLSRFDLKTGLPKVEPLTQDEQAMFAREFEDAATEVFVAKTRRALTESGAQTFVIGGGVAANAHIRKALERLLTKDFSDVTLYLPDPSTTGDNAIMIAQAALAHLLRGQWRLNEPPAEIRAQGTLSLAKVRP